ncbi:MAG: hemolysin family protein [Pseudomonadota bacterium]
MTLTVLIPLLVVLLLIHGFFSGSEMAVVNADRNKLRAKAHVGNKGAKIALAFLSNPTRFFSVVLFGTNICIVSASVVVTLYIIKTYGFEYLPLAMLYGPLALLFGEVLPKSVYQRHADNLVVRVAPLLQFFYYLLYPFVTLLTIFTNIFLRKVKKAVPHTRSLEVTREDLELMVEPTSSETGTTDIKLYERTMVSRILDLAEKRVENVMTPLVDIVALPITASRDDVINALEENEYSRIPVYKDRIFNIVGVIKGADLIFNQKDMPLKKFISPIVYVPEDMHLDELLISMRREESPMAVAVDEYGAATGLVTAEDLWEEVVGEIRDEHDEDVLPYKTLGKNNYLVSGRLEIEQANDDLDLDIPEGDYETIAGLLLHHLEHIPKQDEKLTLDNLTFIVRRASKRVILEVEVIKK